MPGDESAPRNWQLLRTMLRMRRFEEAVFQLSSEGKFARAFSHLHRPGGGGGLDHRRARTARPARHHAPQPRPHHRARRRSGEGAGGNSGARRRAQRRPERNAASLRSFARLYFDLGGGRRLHLARGRRRLCLQAGRRRRGGGRVLRRRRARRGRQLRGHERRVADAAAGAVRLREQQRRTPGARRAAGSRALVHAGGADLLQIPRALGIESVRVNGTDSDEISAAAIAAIAKCRDGRGPVFIESVTRTMGRQQSAVAGAGRPAKPTSAWRPARRRSQANTPTGTAITIRCCGWRGHSPQQGTDAVGRIHFYDAEIREDMKRAMQEALESPLPEPANGARRCVCGPRVMSKAS